MIKGSTRSGARETGRGRRGVLTVLLACTLMFVARQQAAAAPLQVDPLRDGIALGVGISYAGVSELLVRNSTRDVLGTPDRSEVDALDRAAIFDYSAGLNTTADAMMFATILTPAAYAFSLDFADFVTAGIVYVEALAFADAAKNTLKLLIPRYRPYMYSGGASGVDSRENDQSFPSGDSTVAFAAATAGVSIFWMYFPDSPWAIPFTAGAYGLAVLTATLRVYSGMHFITDVAAGALLGSAIGYLVPALHRSRTEQGRGISLQAAPAGIAMTFRY